MSNTKLGQVLTVSLTLFFMMVSRTVMAEDVGGFSYEAGLTAIALNTSDKRIKNEETASADLWLRWQMPSGRWALYLEGNTTPRTDGVSTVIGESNADAGTALDKIRRGRVQISVLDYTHNWDATRSLTVGMIDASSYLDASRIANDENTQFLGVSFVNNPTIQFPDYAGGSLRTKT